MFRRTLTFIDVQCSDRKHVANLNVLLVILRLFAFLFLDLVFVSSFALFVFLAIVALASIQADKSLFPTDRCPIQGYDGYMVAVRWISVVKGHNLMQDEEWAPMSSMLSAWPAIDLRKSRVPEREKNSWDQLGTLRVGTLSIDAPLFDFSR